MTNITCAVIGAGPTGLSVAQQLFKQGIAPEQIRIIDQHKRPLLKWDHDNMNIGRTEDGHYGIRSLVERTDNTVASAYPITQGLVERLIGGLREMITLAQNKFSGIYIQGRVSKIERSNGRIGINLQDGTSLQADNIVLAIGDKDIPRWPIWAQSLREQYHNAPIHHIFDAEFKRERDLKLSGHTVVIGSGRPAVELALYLAEKHVQVTLVARNLVKRESEFYVDRQWLPGGSSLAAFQKESDPGKKWDSLRHARPAGINPRHFELLKRAVDDGEITLLERVKIHSVNYNNADHQVHFNLEGSEDVHQLDADQVFLTNFQANSAKEALIENIAQSLKAPLNRDTRLAELNDKLEWVPSVYVTGDLSSWQTGPASTLTQGVMAAEVIAEDIARKNKGSSRLPRASGVGT